MTLHYANKFDMFFFHIYDVKKKKNEKVNIFCYFSCSWMI